MNLVFLDLKSRWSHSIRQCSIEKLSMCFLYLSWACVLFVDFVVKIRVAL